MTENFREKVLKGADCFGIELTQLQTEQLYEYYRMLVEKNKDMNLTAITEEDDVITKHIIDSLSLASCIRITSQKMIDVGTGAGLPGMILKIAFPQTEMTLFDSLKKRLVFLDEVSERLGLEKTATLHGRAEDLGRNEKYRESFDIVVSRAVANMNSLSEYCLPFVKKNGIFAAYKSAESHEEIKNALGAVKKLGGSLTEENVFILPGTEIERRIAIITKVKSTPAAYPRKAGTPSKDPLK